MSLSRSSLLVGYERFSMLTNYILLFMNPSWIYVIYQWPWYFWIDDNADQMSTRDTYQIEMSTLTFPMIKLRKELTDKLSTTRWFLRNKISNLIFLYLLTIFRLRIISNQYIHQPTLNFILEEVYICGVMFDNSCVNYWDFVYFTL